MFMTSLKVRRRCPVFKSRVYSSSVANETADTSCNDVTIRSRISSFPLRATSKTESDSIVRKVLLTVVPKFASSLTVAMSSREMATLITVLVYSVFCTTPSDSLRRLPASIASE